MARSFSILVMAGMLLSGCAVCVAADGAPGPVAQAYMSTSLLDAPMVNTRLDSGLYTTRLYTEESSGTGLGSVSEGGREGRGTAPDRRVRDQAPLPAQPPAGVAAKPDEVPARVTPQNTGVGIVPEGSSTPTGQRSAPGAPPNAPQTGPTQPK